MKTNIISILVLLSQFTFGQALVTIPEFPTENDSIKIIFNAQEGGMGMMGYTGTLYTHTGVITNISNPSWSHVIGDWGNNSTQPVLTRIGTDLYELVIGYPREFYDLTDPSEHILQLAFVFRSSDATQQTEDLFADIYEPGLNLLITEPEVTIEFGDPLRSPVFAFLGDTLGISIEAIHIGTLVSSITLFEEGIQVAQTTSDSLHYNFITNNYSVGFYNYVAIAVDTSNIADTVSFVVLLNEVPANIPPPAGTIQGINYVDDNTVTLSLWAPDKEFVYVIGDFHNTDWKVDLPYVMNRYDTGDSVVFWITIDNLNSQEEHGFQYLVDGNLRIADPYTEKILDPWNDEFIDDETYPNLKPYPENKTAEAVSIFQTAQTQYQWQINEFERPALTDLVIYELLVRDFLETHDYQTLKDTLDYLENLGVNAIELMPVNEFEGNISWGYNPAFYFAPDKYYGPANDLKAFIDECHERGIAVILDAVLNHTFGQSPFVRLYASGRYGPPTEDNPWLNVVARHPFNVGYDFNHESIHTKNLVDRFNRYWLEYYNVDGYRFDLSKGFTQTNSGSNVGFWGQYDQSRIDILTRMADEIWSYDSTTYVILEHFANNDEEIVLSDYGMMLWGNMNYNYNEATMGYHEDNKSDLTWGSYKARGWDNPHLITYMESHDEERLMFKNLQFGNSSGSYNVRNLNIALQRIKLASAFFFTIPGPKMIWQFGEVGYDFSINWPTGTSSSRTDPKPIRWDYFDVITRKNLYKVMQALINIKKEYDVFRTTDYALNVTGAVKRIKLNHESMDIVIIGNFDVVQKSIIPSFNNTGTWYDFFSGDSIEVINPSASISLEPGEFHIYSNVPLPTPEPGILSNVEEFIPGIVEEYQLQQNYPNPFNPSTIISYQLPEASLVSLKIYNMLGEEVKTLIAGEQRGGIYRVSWDGENNFGDKVSSGIYLYKLSAGNFIQTKKMMLLK